MAKLTRRGFLKQSSMSVATIGALTAGLAAAPVLTAEPEVPDAAATDLTELSSAALSEPLIAHVRDLTTGEVSVLVGTQEIIYRDPQLVMRLLQVIR